MDKYFKMALLSIIRFGDTDIFPFPFERLLFADKLTECKEVLLNYHKNLEDALIVSPPVNLVELSQVGYYGFRQATLIEPFWNAYYLGLVLSIADKIEKSRIPESEEIVFSYRYNWNEDDHTIFNNSNWLNYKKKCIEKSKNYNCIVQTDISNFYPRINHHKLDNELKRVEDKSDTPKRIITLLSKFSGTISYGLPVGGPASRILSELALNQIDRHLKSRKIEFCRYADDYTIFCDNQSEGYKILLLLSEKLANDQLSLQKSKTKFFNSSEFQEIHEHLDPIKKVELMDDEQKLLSLSISFDPYSATATEDYIALKDAIKEIDIIGILSREVNKTRIDQTVTKQAVNAINALEAPKQLAAIKILLDIDNLLTLSPIFTSIMRATRRIYNDLDNLGKQLVDRSLLELFKSESHLVKIEINLSYIVQVLSLEHSQEKEELFVALYEKSTNHFFRRQIIIAMANFKCHYWLVDIKPQFTTSTIWERRSLIYSSYMLGDEGKHWRNHSKKLFSNEEKVIREWADERIQKGKPVLV